MKKPLEGRPGWLQLASGVAVCLLLTASAVGQGNKKADDKVEPLKVGDKAPDFELDTFDDKKVKLSDRFGEKPKSVVLLFSRAHW